MIARRTHLAVLVATVGLLSACATDPTPTATQQQPSTQQQAAAASPIQELKLLTPPTALNLDRTSPGPDGFAARIYAVRQQPYGLVAIESGVLEILLFDGVVSRADIRETEPHQTWTFPPDRLVSARQNAAIGVGYNFTLRWNEQPRFQANDVTVVARYVPGDNIAPVYSDPITLGLRAH